MNKLIQFLIRAIQGKNKNKPCANFMGFDCTAAGGCNDCPCRKLSLYKGVK